MLDQDMTEIEDPRKRFFNHKNVTYTIKASDPYGFWTISVPKKVTPKAISGNYTSVEEAEKAIIVYSNNS